MDALSLEEATYTTGVNSEIDDKPERMEWGAGVRSMCPFKYLGSMSDISFWMQRR